MFDFCVHGLLALFVQTSYFGDVLRTDSDTCGTRTGVVWSGVGVDFAICGGYSLITNNRSTVLIPIAALAPYVRTLLTRLYFVFRYDRQLFSSR